ncbi:putative Rpc11-DNA-directed RNA polymerase III subunit C11 [Jimgerdemannia flammicorona]|uniref:DNA-directed RNA polymerase subunit n=2 Tax=Jimgerdemannia flammicorona TaxID=994334 RepID=A0A433DER0_9FUNG|nr:putative Rpc11-DNA-directed RNA polymerase III subunit C11 [Jimgerdemannia flammicorona]RUS35037.1 putative Rpc11-DNA-directed RNA polymerase III subunit C11 [Jimgerdemannia flammicorona]
MLFCPSCANVLLVQNDGSGQVFYCQTCPYVFPIHGKHASRKRLQRKEVDDVLGGAEAWQNVDSTEAPCPKCEHPRAYFMQIQIRSADEPMSTFYKCCNPKCGYQWKEM